MRTWKLLAMICIFTLSAVAQAGAKGGAMVLNGETSISINKTSYDARISAAFATSAEGLKSGLIDVDQFNLVIFDVPQSAITGRKAIGQEIGTLGFAVSGKGMKLSYDPIRQTIQGELEGYVNVPGYIDPKPSPIDISSRFESHVFGTITQNARLKVAIQATKELQSLIGIENQSSFRGDMRLGLSVDGNDKLDIAGYRIESTSIAVAIDFGWYLEFARHLCVQPVHIALLKYQPWPPYITVQYSGDGLPFGQPGAITQWKKADLTFHWNSWQTVLDPAFWEFSAGESAALRATVDDPECVEVFFVNTFTPADLWAWGGGGTFASGTSATQIISSDENADYGVDLTHLAHELGHAVSLCHPGSVACAAKPEMNPSSSGTLMCPSGFNNDNPTINSVENESNVNNPLITFALKMASPGPDCNNDVDCGPCP
jgi:hypothetical protein